MKIAIIGGSGYTGAELLKILVGHPRVEIAMVTSNTYAGSSVCSLYPQFRGECDLHFSKFDHDAIKASAELVFLAVPHGESMVYVPKLISDGLKVIDLSGDFRFLDTDVYELWYGKNHTAKELTRIAVYGLPEFNRDLIKPAQLVANPGCYPTASLLAIVPALLAGLASPDEIIIDAKSGISGAGRGSSEKTHYNRRTDNIAAYAVAGHKHTPEIEVHAGALLGQEITLTFTPHLCPMSRGILATAYLKVEAGLDVIVTDKAYRDFYDGEDFVSVLEPPAQPETVFVRGSNRAQIGLALDKRTDRLIVTTAIDNLVKGASGQAVQSMNIMAGFPEKLGLEAIGLFP